MANAFTVNLVLTKPEVGADSNLWGGHLNGDMDILDGIFTSASTTFVSIVQKDDSKYVNATTTSKGFILSASLVSTSTTRTLSVPDATGTIALQSYVDAAMPTGVVIPWAGVSTTAPTGWLLCSGQAVSRTTYLTLFNAVNTAYGAGDGSTTFNVPDLRGRTVAGLDNIGGSAASRLTATTMSPNGTTLGATGGSQTETASVTITGSASVNGGTSGPNNVTGTNNGASGDFATSIHAHNISFDAPVTGSGSTAVVTNVQPTLTLNYIIKT